MPNTNIFMKKILFLVVAFFAIQIVSAQDSTSVAQPKFVNYSMVDVKPEFPGGIEEFYKFIGKNYKMPNVKKLMGKVYVTYIIDIDGSIVDVKVLRDIGYGTGQEAIRVLESSPKWKPAEQNGQKVRCSYSLPISLQSS
jgi:protein TonB